MFNPFHYFKNKYYNQGYEVGHDEGYEKGYQDAVQTINLNLNNQKKSTEDTDSIML